MRKYGRTDSNHSAIVDALRQAGCSVQSLASVGGGVPDLLIARCGNLALLEVKDGSQPPSKRRLTIEEQQWHLNWKSPVYVVESVKDAVDIVNKCL